MYWAVRNARSRWNAANTGYHPLKSPSVGLPGDYWQVDILSLPQTTEGHNYALIVLDLFTGFCIGRALRTKSASEVAHHLNQIISEWGPPRILHTDEGSEFLNAILSELTNIYNVKQKIAPAYNHRSIGAVERLNRTIRNSLHKILKGALGSWDLILPRVIFFYNTTVRSTSNSTPYALMFGRMSNLHAPMLNASELTFDANAWLQSQRTLFESIYPAIKEVIDRKHERANDKFNQKHRMVDELAPCTTVAVKELVRGSKSNPPFLTGNFTVKGKDSTNGACLAINNDSDGQTTRHISQLKVVPTKPATHAAGVEESKEYTITSILDHKGDAREPSKATYLVHWKGYSQDEDSWIPYDHFVDKKPNTAYRQKLKLKRKMREEQLLHQQNEKKRRTDASAMSATISREEKTDNSHDSLSHLEHEMVVDAHAANTPIRRLKRPIFNTLELPLEHAPETRSNTVANVSEQPTGESSRKKLRMETDCSTGNSHSAEVTREEPTKTRSGHSTAKALMNKSGFL